MRNSISAAPLRTCHRPRYSALMHTKIQIFSFIIKGNSVKLKVSDKKIVQPESAPSDECAVEVEVEIGKHRQAIDKRQLHGVYHTKI